LNDIRASSAVAPAADLTALVAQLASRQLTCLELTRRYLTAIENINPQLGAYTYVVASEAESAARAADDRRARGRILGPLDGVPVAIKANIAVTGWPLTAGLKFRRDEIANHDAFLVAQLRAAGAVLLGLTNMDEGALGAEGANPWYLTTHNPLRNGYCAGGSSAGAAAALGANLCAMAIGTDTIGSLRIPAAFCGVTSLKPSYGIVSVGGVVPVHLRFDHAGPITASARDLGLVLPALLGRDPLCSVSIDPPRFDLAAARANKVIGYGVGFADVVIGDEVISAYNLGLAALRELGYTLVPLDFKRWDLPRLRRAVLTLCELEMWRAHRGRITDRPDDFSDGLRAFIRYGGRLTPDEVAAAEARIARFYQDWVEATANFAAVALPTTACVSFPHRERRPQNTADLTAIASATGQPALSLPLPHTAGALPAALQLLGRQGGDAALIELAAQLQALWRVDN
jgi:aspartyl-tRNA(Asn)/glutamyl-tRNA(Gln) amidotransferase subunit A